MSVLSSSCPHIGLTILDHTLLPHSSRIVCTHSVRDMLVWEPYYIVPCELFYGQSRDKEYMILASTYKLWTSYQESKVNTPRQASSSRLKRSGH